MVMGQSERRRGGLARRRRSLPGIEALVGNGFLTAQEAAAVLKKAARTGHYLSDVLREEHPGVPVAAALDHPFVDLVEIQIDTEAVINVPEQLARRHSVLPIGFDGADLVLAIPDPTNVIAIDDVRTVTGCEIRVVLAEQGAIEDAWVRVGALDRSTERLLTEAVEEEE